MDEIFTLKTNNLKIGFASHGTRDVVICIIEFGQYRPRQASLLKVKILMRCHCPGLGSCAILATMVSYFHERLYFLQLYTVT